MLFIDDKLTRHPKLLKAGARLGEDGVARAFYLYLDGLSYAISHNTDGFVPDGFVNDSSSVRCRLDVARVLADRRVNLWHRVRGGWRIHDFHDWNRTAKERNDFREKKRRQKQAERQRVAARQPGDVASVSPGDSRARGTTYHVPLGDRRTSSGSVRTTFFSDHGDANASRFPQPVENPTTKGGDDATSAGPLAPAIRDSARDTASGSDHGEFRLGGNHQGADPGLRQNVSDVAGQNPRGHARGRKPNPSAAANADASNAAGTDAGTAAANADRGARDPATPLLAKIAELRQRFADRLETDRRRRRRRPDVDVGPSRRLA